MVQESQIESIINLKGNICNHVVSLEEFLDVFLMVEDMLDAFSS